MMRTQMMIPVQLKKKLERSAKRHGVSMAELIRRFAEEKLAEEKKKRKHSVEALRNAAKHAKNGIDNKINSENFRQYYYEMKNLK